MVRLLRALGQLIEGVPLQDADPIIQSEFILSLGREGEARGEDIANTAEDPESSDRKVGIRVQEVLPRDLMTVWARPFDDELREPSSE